MQRLSKYITTLQFFIIISLQTTYAMQPPLDNEEEQSTLHFTCYLNPTHDHLYIDLLEQTAAIDCQEPEVLASINGYIDYFKEKYTLKNITLVFTRWHRDPHSFTNHCRTLAKRSDETDSHPTRKFILLFAAKDVFRKEFVSVRKLTAQDWLYPLAFLALSPESSCSVQVSSTKSSLTRTASQALDVPIGRLYITNPGENSNEH